MSKIFTRTFRVRFSELDAVGQVGPDSYLRYLVETAYDWGETLGLGTKETGDFGIFWLIRETELHLVRPMHHNDIFDFTIWMVNWQRVRGTRCFELRLKESGEQIAWGTQNIVCMDAGTGRPTNPPEEVINNFKLEEPHIFPFERFPRISPPQTSFITRRTVEWRDLDTLEHVNNAVYVTFAEEAAVQEFSSLGWPPSRLSGEKLALVVQRVHIQYLSPAVWGEVLDISTHTFNRQAAGGSRYVGIARTDGSQVAECILDWKLVDKENGTERPLPGGLWEKLAG